MSWQAKDWAMTQVQPGLVKLPALAVLFIFADYADKDGRAARPALFTVAWRLGCTERNVAAHVKSLKSAGLLIESPDQSSVAHLPADERPIVYDLPITWVRSDTLEDAREEHRRKRRARRSEPSCTDDTYGDQKTSPADAGTQRPSDATGFGYEESFATGMKDSAQGYEGSFRAGTKRPSYKQALEPTVEPSLEHTARDSRLISEQAESLCVQLHALALRNWNGRGREPEITAAWRQDARGLLIDDGRPLSEAVEVISYSQAGWWSGRVKSMSKLRQHYDTMLDQMDGNHRARSRPAGSVVRLAASEALKDNPNPQRLAAGGLAAVPGLAQGPQALRPATRPMWPHPVAEIETVTAQQEGPAA